MRRHAAIFTLGCVFLAGCQSAHSTPAPTAKPVTVTVTTTATRTVTVSVTPSVSATVSEPKLFMHRNPGNNVVPKIPSQKRYNSTPNHSGGSKNSGGTGSGRSSGGGSSGGGRRR